LVFYYTGTYWWQDICIQGFGRETPLGRSKCRWKDNSKLGLLVVEWGAVNWIELALDRVRWRALVNVVMSIWLL